MKALIQIAILLGVCHSLVALAFKSSREALLREQEESVSATIDGAAEEIDSECRDRHLLCDQFADNEQCESSPGWMAIYCPVACSLCHLRYAKDRCDPKQIYKDSFTPSPLDDPTIEYMNMNRSRPIYEPGDLNRMFESIVPRFGHRYEINILSTSPYVVTIDNFLTDEEQRALTENVMTWVRSYDTGRQNAFGNSGSKVSGGRTSSNAWCSGECGQHPVVAQVYSKIAEITKIPRSYYEQFQVLRYEVGERYTEHHDNSQGSDENRFRSAGHRALTFFLYLSDVEEGGETCFTIMGICVRPKRGRALLWPSVKNSDPSLVDSRTMHEAKPVIQGRKYAANTWIHLQDYALAQLWSCSGAGLGDVPDELKPGLLD